MTIEQFIAVIGALVALLGVMVQLLIAIRSLHAAVNGRLTMLLDAATQAARKDGELAGRDFIRGQIAAAQSPESSSSSS